MAYPPISTLPSPPSRQDPANFADEADAFLGALPTFQSEANSLGSYIDTAGANIDADLVLVEEWATKTDGIVNVTDYSSKAWAVGGTGVTDTASRGAAKEWATKAEDSTVDGTSYSALHHAAKSSASATAAANSATAAANSAGSVASGAWSSGASYSVGDIVYSTIDYLSYRAKTTHSGETTDPSSDTTNWQALGGIAGLTATATELNILDGATITTTELNTLDGITATTTELNLLDGATVTTAEINYLDITTLGTTEASKAVTADANGVVTFDNGISEEYVAVTSTSNATTIDLQAATNFSHTLTENTTFTFSNPAASGKVSSFTLKLVQDASASGYVVTWPSSIDWVDATAPTLTATASAVDYLVFLSHDGGTTWYGFVAGQALA